jgi:hypothetical protein
MVRSAFWCSRLGGASLSAERLFYLEKLFFYVSDILKIFFFICHSLFFAGEK